VRTLRKLRFSTVEPTYEHGQVWRIARDLTEQEIHARLAKLPCIFTGSLDFHLEHLEAARDARWFRRWSLAGRGSPVTTSLGRRDAMLDAAVGSGAPGELPGRDSLAGARGVQGVLAAAPGVSERGPA